MIETKMTTLAIWPDYTWCYLEAIECYTWKSDDYETLDFDELQQSADDAVDEYFGLIF